MWTVVIGRSPLRTLQRAIWLALAAAVVFGLLLRPVVIRGRSMEPTLRDGSLRLATRWWFGIQRTPARADVVVIRRVGGRNFYLKRVLGLPGETVAFDRGMLLIDGARMPEPYLLRAGDWSMPELVLGPDEYFVAGDNRVMPMVDHAAGRVDRRRFAGRIWP